MIAGALSVNPSIVLADEATTAVDVTTQAEIVKLLGRLSAERGLSVLFITHDLALADIVCSRVCVMYAGRIVEVREGRQIFEDPIHPYTIDLLAARPTIEHRVARLPVIKGVPTSAMDAPPGCPFHPRCRFALEECREGVPAMVPVRGGMARCFRAHEELAALSDQESVPSPEGGQDAAAS
jgi:oligopeptide/dipeptide ABC transporter ATP-binding protein